MSIKSNLYAEKIFAEHPIGLWSLDDNTDYLSLISEAQRNLTSLWTSPDSTVTSDTSDLNQPFSNSVKNLIEFDDFVGAEKELKFTGPDLISLNQLNFDLATLTTASYFYTESAFLKSISAPSLISVFIAELSSPFLQASIKLIFSDIWLSFDILAALIIYIIKVYYGRHIQSISV